MELGLCLKWTMDIVISSYTPVQGNEGSNPSTKSSSVHKEKGGIFMVNINVKFFLEIKIILTILISLSITGNVLV